ncbi:CMT1A duplicated region transcript 1 protein isoform X2 [Sus scrofa]|uniref:CMT1A duplicated region transcript 1 protein isoform X2 n=1 Tax=Sus scrofa TaxID=9823 RepID=UPI000A2B4BB3|nr:CMT1A duplicated region transcript 1 protein isoform X2 [Sus scrofa]
MENLELRLKNAPYFRCERGDDSVPVCRKCETCVLAWKVFSTKEWFRRVGESSQTRFLVSVLVQLDSLYLLHYFQNILQTTQGKDFVYHRSRVNLSNQEGRMAKFSLNQRLDKTVEQKMRELLCWFGNSTHQMKVNYTLLLMQMCQPKLLLTAASVIRVLFQREWSSVSGTHPDFNDVFFFPEKGHAAPGGLPQVCWAARTKHATFSLSQTSGKANLQQNVRRAAAPSDGRWKSSVRCISEMTRLFPEKASESRAESAPRDVLVDPDAVRELSSGLSSYRDFIRQLPAHLSKHILSMLDRNTLNRCASVSQHWAALAHQVRTDLSVHSFIQHQLAFLQGSYTRGVDPRYAHRVTIPVPKMADGGTRLRVKSQKWKLRTKNDYSLWSAYQSQETQQVQLEERNVFCGTYNIRILSDMWDRNRIIHYSGGGLLAVSSNRKIHLLDLIQIKELPVKFRGHAGSVRALFLCEEENFLLSGSYDLSIRYWDLKSGACVRIFNGHQGTITCMDVHKNRLASGAKDCQVKEWDIDTGKCLKTFRHKDPILATRINDTYIVSSCEKGTVKVWQVATAQLLKEGATRNRPSSGSHSSLTGERALGRGGTGSTGLGAKAKSAQTLNGHEGAVRCLCFDQWHLVSGSADGLVMAWSMVGKYERCLMAFKHPKPCDRNVGKVTRTWGEDPRPEGSWFTSRATEGRPPRLQGQSRPLPAIPDTRSGLPEAGTARRSVPFQGGAPRGPSLPPGHQCLCGWQDPHLQPPQRALPEGDEGQWQRMVINTESNVLMFQFENVKWQYPPEQAGPKDKAEDKEENSLTEVLSKSSTQINSPRDSTSSKQTARESLLSKPHKSRAPLRVSRLPTALTEAPLSQGKPKSPRKDGRRQMGCRGADGTAGEQENLEAKSLTGDDAEKVPKQGQLGTGADLMSRPKKKSWHIAMSPDQLLLTVHALQKAHTSGECAYPRRPQAQVLDAWGPSISYPRKVLSLKGQSVQHAVDRLRRSSPPTDVRQTSVPLEVQKLQPNLKTSLQSPRVQSTIPQPVLIRPRFSGSSKGEDGATSSTEGTVRSSGPLTSPQVIKPNRMLAPPLGGTAQAAKKDRPRFHTALDPFRMNTEFMLLTVKEEKEYEQAKVKENQAAEPAGRVDPERASRAAWIRKIKGLPIDDFMKPGKTAAPELGQNIFI